MRSGSVVMVPAMVTRAMTSPTGFISGEKRARPTTTAMANADDPDLQAFSRWADELVWQRCFDGRMEDRAHVMGVFERHNDAVIASVPADRLLVFEASEGWGPLCRFLDVPEPDEDYPRTNTSQEFAERRASDAP